MKIVKRIIIVCSLIIVSAYSLLGDTMFLKENQWFVGIFTGLSSAGSYYNINNKLITNRRLSDGSEHVLPGDTAYSFDFTSNSFGFHAEYGIMSDLKAVVELPFIYHSFTKTLNVQDTITSSYDYSKEYSLFQVYYYSLGLNYQILSGSSILNASAKVLIPPKFSNPGKSDNTRIFMDDQAFESYLGLEYIQDFKDSWLGFAATYNGRSDKYDDLYILHIEAGSKKVKDTKLYLTMDYASPFKKMNDSTTFNILKSQPSEQYIALGACFGILFDNFYPEISYTVRIAGKNTWNIGIFYLRLGLKI